MKRKTLKFEAVKVINPGPESSGWTVKTQYRGMYYTVVETFALPGRANAKEIADLIAKQLNEHFGTKP